MCHTERRTRQDKILENLNSVLEGDDHNFLSENKQSKDDGQGLILSYFIFLYNTSMYF